MAPFSEADFESYSGSDVKGTVDLLTKRVFANIYCSVYPEHRLLITTLILLNIQQDAAEPPFTEEDLSFLVYGNPGFGKEIKVDLSDFNCEASPPDWLPADRWDDLLAFGVYHEDLMKVCVSVAEESALWKEWYLATEPETIKFPASASQEEPDLSELHRLLLVKTLRPDRFQPALISYVQRHLEGTPMEEVVSSSQFRIDVDALFNDVSNTLGILVLLPDDSDPEVMSRVTSLADDAIRRLAEKQKVSMEKVVLGDGYLQEATRCIDSALSQDSWALIHGLHLAPSKFFEELQIQLARVGNVSRKSEGGEGGHPARSQAAHFQVWLTSKSHASLPSLLTQYLFKMSWDSLMQMVDDTPLIDSIAPGNLSILKSSILSAFSMVLPEICANWLEAPEPSRALLFTVPLCHALLMARQSVGWHGNHKRYSIQEALLNQVLLSILQENSDLSTIKQIYSDVITVDSDQIFMTFVFDEVIEQVTSSKGSVVLYDVSIPVPPSRMQPSEIVAWFREHLPDDMSLTTVLSLPRSATLWRTMQSSETIGTQLQHLSNAVQQPGYETNLLSPGCTHDVNEPSLTLGRLQNVLDLCWDKLPPLLELGQANQGKLTSYDFPYHRPSVLSTEETGMPHMPESIGFVLLKECVWFNQCLCVARQQVHDLRRRLFETCDYKLSKELKATAVSLYEEEVPVSWQHPNEIPNTHVLLTWIDDVTRRYAQMRSWVKTGMVPLDGKTPVGPVTSIWLGGLVNPGALLMALCTEAVAACETSHDQIRIRCVAVKDQDDIAEQTAGMYLENVHLLNCTWDEEKACFRRSADDQAVCVQPCPLLYFHPTVIGEDEEEQETAKEKDDLVEYPVYMNVSRQSLVACFPLASGDVTRYHKRHKDLPRAHDCGVLLQSGPDLSQRDTYKSRAYMAQKRRERWSRVSPAVSELMSRSGTRMSSARQSLSGPRMSVTSLPPSIAGAVKAPAPEDAGSQHPDENQQPHLYQEDTFVVSQKSLSSHASSLADAPHSEEDPLPGPPQPPAARPLPNGGVKHLKSDEFSDHSGEGQGGQVEQPLGGDIPHQSSQGRHNDSSSGEELNAQDSARTDPQLEREGSLFKTILDDETTEEET